MNSEALKSIRTLDYVILLCKDIPSMKTFYHEIMGFQIYRADEEWARHCSLFGSADAHTMVQNLPMQRS